MSDTFGPTSLTPFAQYDRDTQSWRTSVVTSLWALPMSSLTLPKSGGLQNGELTERPMLAHPTGVSDCSSLPTPTGQDGANVAGPSQFNRNSLPLNAFVMLLPTPAVMDMGSNYTPEQWQAWKDKQKASHNNGNGHGASLTQEALTMLPTPRAQDSDESPTTFIGRTQALQQKPGRNGGTTGMPLGVLAQLIGESTPPQSDDGSLF